MTATGLLTNGVSYRNVGVELQVTPRISPDGKVLMRVDADGVVAWPTTSISLGNGVTAVAFNVQDVDTTVTAQDGETVAIGGLISRNDTKTENKVPWLGDLPYVGAAVPLPHADQGQDGAAGHPDAARRPEPGRGRPRPGRGGGADGLDGGRRDAVPRPSGMEPVLHPQQYPLPLPSGGVDGALPSPLDGPVVPAPPGPETLPAPRPLPPGEALPPPVPGPQTAAPAVSPVQQASAVIPTPGVPVRAPVTAPAPAAPLAPTPDPGLEGASQFMPKKW